MACPPEPGTDREIRGTDIRAIQILAKMYEMELNFTSGNAGVTDVVHRNATELLGDVIATFSKFLMLGCIVIVSSI